MVPRELLCVVLIVVGGGAPALAAEHPALARARALYNAADYDGAIDAATMARVDPTSADAAALVVARSHLERHRAAGDSADLAAARAALNAIRPALLSPRDQVDLLVGLGQALFLDQAFGAAAEMFDTALGQSPILPEEDRLLLLDWWATAVDRHAQELAPDRRAGQFALVRDRMEAEVRLDPGSAPANYWLVAASRGAGETDRAWHAAVAGWVRAMMRPESSAALRTDLDRLVREALIPERARARPASEQAGAVLTLREQWDAVKDQWP